MRGKRIEKILKNAKTRKTRAFNYYIRQKDFK